LSPCLDPLFDATFREHYSLLHQGEKQSDTKLLLWKISYMYLLFSGKGEGSRTGYEGRRERGEEALEL